MKARWIELHPTLLKTVGKCGKIHSKLFNILACNKIANIFTLEMTFNGEKVLEVSAWLRFISRSQSSRSRSFNDGFRLCSSEFFVAWTLWIPPLTNGVSYSRQHRLKLFITENLWVVHDGERWHERCCSCQILFIQTLLFVLAIFHITTTSIVRLCYDNSLSFTMTWVVKFSFSGKENLSH